MSDVQRHYESLLAAHYAWMNGPFDAKVSAERALLAELGIGPGGLAVDLGCGPGYQAVALRELGFEAVLGIDTSRTLLDALDARGDGAIRTVLADLRDLAAHVAAESADAIVCMGDTLTHLDSRSDVTALLRAALTALRPGGRLVLTFRDLSTALTGLDRFLPVRADDTRIMTCALEYDNDEHVTVNDLIHVRTEQGWDLRKSRYRKLRLPPATIAAELTALGLVLEHDRPTGRLHTLAARKP